jgi:hypothetical protein
MSGTQAFPCCKQWHAITCIFQHDESKNAAAATGKRLEFRHFRQVSERGTARR